MGLLTLASTIAFNCPLASTLYLLAWWSNSCILWHAQKNLNRKLIFCLFGLPPSPLACTVHLYQPNLRRRYHSFLILSRVRMTHSSLSTCSSGLYKLLTHHLKCNSLSKTTCRTVAGLLTVLTAFCLPGYNPQVGSKKFSISFSDHLLIFSLNMHSEAGRISDTPMRTAGVYPESALDTSMGPLSPTSFLVLLRCSVSSSDIWTLLPW